MIDNTDKVMIKEIGTYARKILSLLSNKEDDENCFNDKKHVITLLGLFYNYNK